GGSMRALRIGAIAVSCLALTAGAAMITARGQYARPGEIGANHVVVDNKVQVAGTVAIDSAKPVGVRAVQQPWEYRMLTRSSGQDPAKLLATAGLDGWEAVGYQSGSGGISVLLKRPR